MMNPVNLTHPRKKSVYKLDKTSDRYRICPNDGVEFMANDRREKFCNPRCADEYHNLKKKELTKTNIASQIDVTSQIDTTETQEVELPINLLTQNINLLESLSIDNLKGTRFSIDWLFSLGLDFSYFNGKGKLHNIDTNQNCHFLQMGNFRLFRTEFSQILIIKIN